MIDYDRLYSYNIDPYQFTSTDSDAYKTVYISSRGFEFKTLKEAAIDDIKCQPFYKR